MAAARSEGDRLRAERMRQAKTTFNIALALSIIGVLFIFVGVGLLLIRDAVSAGALTGGVGALTEVASELILRFNKDTVDRLGVVSNDLSSTETAQIGMSLIEKIDDSAKQDDALCKLVRDLHASHRQTSDERI